MKRNHLKKIKLSAVILLVFTLISCGRGCGKKDLPSPPTEKALEDIPVFELIPQKLNVIAGMNIIKVLNSPIGSKIQQKIPLIAQPFINEIEQVSFGWMAEELGQIPEAVLGILTGKFDPNKVEERLKEYSQKNQSSYQVEDYQGYKLYYFQEKPQETLSILSNKIVIGDRNLVKQAIDLALQDPATRTQNSILSQANLMQRVKAIDTKKMLWFTATVPQKSNTEAGNPAANLQAVDLTIDFPAELEFELGLVTATETDAKDMESQALAYQLLYGKRLAQESPDFAKALEAVKIEAQGNRLSISFTLTQELIQDLEKLNIGQP